MSFWSIEVQQKLREIEDRADLYTPLTELTLDTLKDNLGQVVAKHPDFVNQSTQSRNRFVRSILKNLKEIGMVTRDGMFLKDVETVLLSSDSRSLYYQLSPKAASLRSLPRFKKIWDKKLPILQEALMLSRNNSGGPEDRILD